MPIHKRGPSFVVEFSRLSQEEKLAFDRAVRVFETGLRTGRFDRRLRLQQMRGWPGIWEMTWVREDGRATFSYGNHRQRGGPVIIWRRIGRHEIFDQP